MTEMLSVWEGDDRTFLERALEFYPSTPVGRILDCTFNRGKFWKGSKFRPLVTGMDIDPKYSPDLVDDNRVMSQVQDGSFDALVYDPPHVPNQGRDRTKDFRDRFGLGERSGKEHGYSLSHDYLPVMRQAARVLRDEGVAFCKITDYVHNHRYQWALVDLVQAVREAGLTPCDMVVKVRKGPIMDPKWKTMHHARRCHCYWLIARKSGSCQRASSPG